MLIIRQLQTISAVEPEDQASIGALPLRMRDVAENRDIVREGERPTDCCVVLSGLACRYKMVAGGRRQILSLHLPGDLPDMQSLHLNTLDHGVTTLTPCRVGYITHEHMVAITDARPTVAHLLYRHALIDASIFREWIANLGRRTAYERVAHVFCEMYLRMSALGQARDNIVVLPLTQAELGDTVGLSTVHVNRVLQALRQAELIESHGPRLKILDFKRLQQAADFDPAYLHLRAQPAN